MLLVLFAASCTSSAGWRSIRSPPLGLVSARTPRCDHASLRLCAGDDATAKRQKAEQLALRAERAALELAAIEQETELLKLEAQSLARDPEPLTKDADALEPQIIKTAAGSVAEASTDVVTPARPLDSFLAAFNSSGADVAPTVNLASGALRVLLDQRDSAMLQLTESQVEAMRSRIFSIDSFYVSRVEQSIIGTIFRGNLRANSSVAYDRVSTQLAADSDLAGIQLLLLQDPLALTLESLQAGEERLPVFLALPTGATQLKQRLPELGVSTLGLLATVITTLGFSLSTYILADGGAMLAKIQEGDPTPISIAVPIAVAVGGVQLVHEAAHLIAARVHGLRTGVPCFLPSLQIGLFGCITKLLSFPRSRTALFDFAFAGPAVAAGVSLVLYAIGLVLSIDLPVPQLPAGLDASAFAATSSATTAATAVAAPDVASAAAGADVMPLVPSGLLLSSLLLGSLAQAVLPAITASPVVSLHPLAVVGFAGFLINALQCLPIGRLDGGRVASAVLGQGPADLLSGLTLTLLGFSTLFGGDNPILLFFGLIIIFLQRTPELPCADDISGVDATRSTAAAIGAVVAFLTLLPCPEVLGSVGAPPI